MIVVTWLISLQMRLGGQRCVGASDLVRGRSSERRGLPQPVGQQRAERGQVSGDLLHRSARPGPHRFRRRHDPGGSEGAFVMASRPSTAASAEADERGEQSGDPVLAAAGELPGGLVRAQRPTRVRPAGLRLGEAGHDAADLVHAVYLFVRGARWLRGNRHGPALGVRPSSGHAAWPVSKADAVGDLAQVLVGEPAPATAQLPGQHPLAQALTPRGSVLVDRAGSIQQPRVSLDPDRRLQEPRSSPGRARSAAVLSACDRGYRLPPKECVASTSAAVMHASPRARPEPAGSFSGPAARRTGPRMQPGGWSRRSAGQRG